MSELDPKTALFLEQKIEEAVSRVLRERETYFLEKQALRPEEAARALGLGLTSLRQAVADGIVPHFRIGRIVRIPRSAVEAMLQGGGSK